MAKVVFIPSKEAQARYGKDERTLKRWARDGDILYQVIKPESRKAHWYYESPEARYERVMGSIL